VFTPEVNEVLAWFDRTHRLQLGFGVVQWERRSLPGPGAESEQEARLMDALDYVLAVKNTLLLERPRRRRTDDEKKRRGDDESDKGRRRSTHSGKRHSAERPRG
jgi:hypothetical protein